MTNHAGSPFCSRTTQHESDDRGQARIRFSCGGGDWGGWEMEEFEFLLFLEIGEETERVLHSGPVSLEVKRVWNSEASIDGSPSTSRSKKRKQMEEVVEEGIVDWTCVKDQQMKETILAKSSHTTMTMTEGVLRVSGIKFCKFSSRGTSGRYVVTATIALPTDTTPLTTNNQQHPSPVDFVELKGQSPPIFIKCRRSFFERKDKIQTANEPVGKLKGFGKTTETQLIKKGIITLSDFANTDEQTVRLIFQSNIHKPRSRMTLELFLEGWNFARQITESSPMPITSTDMKMTASLPQLPFSYLHEHTKMISEFSTCAVQQQPEQELDQQQQGHNEFQNLQCQWTIPFEAHYFVDDAQAKSDIWSWKGLNTTCLGMYKDKFENFN
eukprot:c12710_g1_i1.p1 GENE.c12710_g1_i1~~c12710_g1_i1.p1  ORF type:complete len:383 (+),score=76.46 c12710_g1_i1:37-1185(+)